MSIRFSSLFILKKALVVFCLMILPGITMAQGLITTDKPVEKVHTDTIIKLRHSPKRAAFLSTVCPGLGQVYNKKYWKVPVIYAGLGAGIFFIVNNTMQYNKYHGAYVNVANANAAGIKSTDSFNGIYSESQLSVATDYYRRNRDLSYAITAGLYALNIIDATVDAHLFFFDISDQLSVHITPTWFSTAILNTEKSNYVAGVCLTLLVIK